MSGATEADEAKGFWYPTHWADDAPSAFKDADDPDHTSHGLSDTFVARMEDRDRALEDYLNNLRFSVPLGMFTVTADGVPGPVISARTVPLLGDVALLGAGTIAGSVTETSPPLHQFAIFDPISVVVAAGAYGAGTFTYNLALRCVSLPQSPTQEYIVVTATGTLAPESSVTVSSWTTGASIGTIWSNPAGAGAVADVSGGPVDYVWSIEAEFSVS